PNIQNILKQLDCPYIEQINQQIRYPEEIVDLLEKSIVDDPPMSITEGNIIKSGYNEQLDTYRDALENGKAWMMELEQKEREITGINSLKVGYNRVFGYYIEITHANKHLIPEGR